MITLKDLLAMTRDIAPGNNKKIIEALFGQETPCFQQLEDVVFKVDGQIQLNGTKPADNHKEVVKDLCLQLTALDIPCPYLFRVVHEPTKQKPTFPEVPILLGTGAFGKVFGAFDSPFVFKECNTPSDASHEITMSQHVPDGPFIKLIKSIKVDGRLVLVYPYCNGTLLEDVRDWTIEDMLSLLGQFTDLAELLKQAGITHNDIKSTNLFWREDGKVVLFDFGLANPKPIGKDVGRLGYNGFSSIGEWSVNLNAYDLIIVALYLMTESKLLPWWCKFISEDDEYEQIDDEEMIQKAQEIWQDRKTWEHWIVFKVEDPFPDLARQCLDILCSPNPIEMMHQLFPGSIKPGKAAKAKRSAKSGKSAKAKRSAKASEKQVTVGETVSVETAKAYLKFLQDRRPQFTKQEKTVATKISNQNKGKETFTSADFMLSGGKQGPLSKSLYDRFCLSQDGYQSLDLILVDDKEAYVQRLMEQTKIDVTELDEAKVWVKELVVSQGTFEVKVFY